VNESGMPSAVAEVLSRRSNRVVLDDNSRRIALRTAFISRFIVLREGRRSRAHRVIEDFVWDDQTTAEELAGRLLRAFEENGDKLTPVKRDIKRALDHAKYSVDYFVEQYLGRSNCSFVEALEDYEKSNRLLFGDDPDSLPRNGGWRLQGTK